MPTLCSSRPRPRDRPSQHALIGYEGTYRRAQCEPACQIPADGSLHRDHVKRAGQIDLEVERLEAEGRERTPPRLVKWAVQATRKQKNARGQAPCMDGGGPRRPGAAWIRTLLSGR
jgi:hypothetical protein